MPDVLRDLAPGGGQLDDAPPWGSAAPTEIESVPINANGRTFQFYFRRQSEADLGVIQQIFVQEDYRIDQFPLGPAVLRHAQTVIDRGAAPLIVDAGANIGASALYFHLVHPAARILAIEPHPGNCALFRRNCDTIASVSLLEGGIASASGRMVLHDPGEGHWGYRLEGTGQQAAAATVPVFGAAQLLDQCEAQGLVPLIVKIDIEGGERELFSRETEWLSRVPLVIIELHDWMLPRQSCSRNFLQALGRGRFDVLWRGENLFCFNNDLLA